MVDAINLDVSGADYIVTDVGGSPGVINGHTRALVGTYASYSAAVNAAIAAAPSTPVLIWIDPLYADDETGTIIINRSKVTLTTGTHVAMENSSTWWTGTTTGMKPRFLRVRFDSTSAEIRCGSISGLALRELDLYSNVNGIHNILVERCGFWCTTATSTSAFLFRGDQIINYVTVNDCWIADGCAVGAIRFTQTTDPGSGQYYFNTLHYKPAGVTNTRMVVFDTAARISQILIFNELDHVNYATGHVWFQFKDSTYDKGVRVINSSFEEHVSCTIFQIDAGSTTRLQRHALEFSHNSGTLAGSGDGAGTVSIIQNSATISHFSSGLMSYLHGHMNRFMSSYASGIMQDGTTGAHARFSYDVGYYYTNVLVETNVVSGKG